MKNIKQWYGGLTKAGKIGVWAASAVVMGSAMTSAQNAPKQPAAPPKPVSQVQQTQQEQPNAPVTTKKTLTEDTSITFEKTSVNDSTLDEGTTTIRTPGVNGVKTSTYEVTYEDGKEVDRKLIKEEVTTAPTTEVTAIGTKVKAVSSCDPNYSGACVPIASDVDCAGGSGNGPAYVSGPVYVVGRDIYGLDRDGNGVGCE